MTVSSKARPSKARLGCSDPKKQGATEGSITVARRVRGKQDWKQEASLGHVKQGIAERNKARAIQAIAVRLKQMRLW